MTKAAAAPRSTQHHTEAERDLPPGSAPAGDCGTHIEVLGDEENEVRGVAQRRGNDLLVSGCQISNRQTVEWNLKQNNAILNLCVYLNNKLK